MECTSNDNCADYQECVSNQCQDVLCDPACGTFSSCMVSDHTGTCVCTSGFVEDPDSNGCGKTAHCICKLGLRICKFSNLYAVFISVECFTDADCYPEKSCVNKECVPVTCDVACGNNAACTIANHVGSCQCNTGYVADPNPETRCGMCKLKKLYFYHY